MAAAVLLAALGCAALAPAGALAQATEAPAPSTPIVPKQASANPQAFGLEVRSSDENIRNFLTQHLDLQRYRSLSDLDEMELTRLLRDADVQARGLLGTLGFFKPTLSWSQDKSSNSPSTGSLGKVLVDVEPGPAARISEVQWQWLGDVADDPDARAQLQAIEQQWALPVGKTFSQDAWSQAKTQTLRQLLAERYPWGRILHSLALVDEPNNQVRLWLTLESGPSVRLGALQISGADKYGTTQVERLARLPVGQVYSQNDLLEAQQRLVTSGFYDSVFVSLDTEGNPAQPPVKIELKESLRQKWVLGLGARSDSGARISAEHTHHSVPGLNWRSVSKLSLDKDLQSVSLDLLAPPDHSLWRWNTSAKFDREKLFDAPLQSQRWRAGRTKLGERIDRSYFAQYDSARLQGDLQLQLESISANYGWTWRNFDSLPFPNRGLGVGVELGSGVTLGEQREPYVRWLVKGLGLVPLGANMGRLAVRAEIGSVVSRDTSSLPATQLFWTGGDNSVRGYAPNSIGVIDADGVTGPGRYLAAGSLEWQRPIRRQGQATEWESAVFVDAGTVTNATSQLKPQVGFGVGARWRSPVGPVRIDLAYAQALQKLRLHLSVGFTF
jgi:translocation and assembly module TamA